MIWGFIEIFSHDLIAFLITINFKKLLKGLFTLEIKSFGKKFLGQKIIR